jgi:outer membrane protein insertion porin family
VFRVEDDRPDNYSYEQTGVKLRVAAPITNNLTAGLAYNFAETRYTGTDSSLSLAYQQGIASSPWIKSSISPTLTFNTLDDRQLPRDGIFAEAGMEVAGLGGDAEFIKFTGRANYFQLLSESQDIIGSVAVGAGHMVSLGDNARVFDQFLQGGETIRGFDARGFGPRSELLADGDRDALGGTTYFNASAEASMPMPVVPRDFGLRVAAFADAGTLYGTDLDPSVTVGGVGFDQTWRASVGASLIWASPFGPLRLDYAVPVAKEEFDDVQEFRFGASSRF